MSDTTLLQATVEPLRSAVVFTKNLRSILVLKFLVNTTAGHLPRADMIFYEILTNIIYTSIGENIQHNTNQKKLTRKAGMILVHMSAQCPDLRE